MPTLLEVSVSLIVSFALSEVLSSDYRKWSAQHRLWCIRVILCLAFVVCVCAFGRQTQFWRHIPWIIEIFAFNPIKIMDFAGIAHFPFAAVRPIGFTTTQPAAP